MNNEAVDSLIKIFIFLPLIIIMIYVVLRYQGKYLMKMGNGKLVKVIERVPVSNKSSLCVVLINEKPYVISSTDDKIEILMELPSESLGNARKDDSSFLSNINLCINTLVKRKGTR